MDQYQLVNNWVMLAIIINTEDE